MRSLRLRSFQNLAVLFFAFAICSMINLYNIFLQYTTYYLWELFFCSFFNTAEQYEVIKYTRKILNSTFDGKHLCQSDIGVVSPYRGQLQRISRTLRNNGMPDICVGSVEEFQGQERRVIIISTVRSNPAQLKLDQKFSLGFVREPRV